MRNLFCGPGLKKKKKKAVQVGVVSKSCLSL